MRAFLLLLLLWPTACRTLEERCEPGDSSALDYAQLDSWVCHPDQAEDVCRSVHAGVEVLPDGSTIPWVNSANPDAPADCFYVYPTVDLSLVAAVHTDFSDTGEQSRTTRIQASRLTAVCRVFAPLYRQVTLGTYAGTKDRMQGCFDTAYGDVARAFDAFLAAVPAGRPLVLVGHSQGAQIISRLVRERLDGNPELRARIAGVLPIGWPLGTDGDGVLHGSSDTVPVCTTADQAGCMVGFRSYAAGTRYPEETQRYSEGSQGVCVHPGDVVHGGPKLLRGAVLNARLRGVIRPPDGVEEGSDTDLLYRDYFRARCVSQGRDRALEVSADPAAGDARSNPIDFHHPSLNATNGTHILDVQLGMLDLVEEVRAMVTGFQHAP